MQFADCFRSEQGSAGLNKNQVLIMLKHVSPELIFDFVNQADEVTRLVLQ
jgi:hypothetical protein